MWRFIVLTFGFLGFSFYELSGGADYAPADGSRQVVAAERAKAKAQIALAKAQAKPEVPAPKPVITAANPEPADAQVVLASAVVSAVKASKPRAETPAKPVVDAAKAAALTETVTPPKDIREVTGNRVNLRRGPGTDYTAVGKLTRGEQVEILSDDGQGWLKLRVIETGRIGYMADFLLTSG